MPDGAAGATSTQLDNNALAQDSNPASRLPPLSQAPLFDTKSDDLRELVLDYLTHSCFIDSALAFVKEWDQSDSVSSSNASFYSSSEAGPSAGPSSSAVTAAGRDGNPAASASSAAFAASAEQAQEDDEDDDQMMQSAYEDLDGTRVNTNCFHAENGDSAAYQDRHHHYPGNKYLSRDEVEQIRARKEIKRLVRQGAIQAAIDLCNLHFPSVLTTEPTSTSGTYSSSSLSAPTSHGPPSGTTTKAALAEFWGSLLRPHPSTPIPSRMNFTNNLVSKNVPSQPNLLSLSLQIQLFVEVVRSAAPAPSGTSVALAPATSISRPSTPLNNAHSPGSANGSMDGSTASLASNVSQGSQASRMSGISNSSSSSTSAISQALSQAQNLHAQASRISDPVAKTAYLKELEAVSGLLPYRDPRQSPVAFYLDERRRDSLAEALNAGILLSLGKISTNSKLENLVRQNDQIWQSLHDLKGTYPAIRGASKADPPKPIMPFSMQDFLDATLDGATAQY